MDNVCTPQDVSEAPVVEGEDINNQFQDEINSCSQKEEEEARSGLFDKISDSVKSVLPDLDLFNDDGGVSLPEKSKKPEDNLTDEQITCNPAATKEEAGQWLEENFDRLDKDSDGYITELEVDNAVKDSSYKGKDAAMVHMLKSRQDDIEELSDDEYGDENDGITRSDASQFKLNMGVYDKEVATVNDAVSRGKENFDMLDADNDGFVTDDEVEEALKDEDLSDEDRAAFELLKDREDDIEEANNDEIGDENDGFTKADLNQYRKDVTYNSELGELYTGVDWDLEKANERFCQASERALFQDADNPIDSIKPDAIDQGRIGDCYFLAALTSMASQPEGKEAISKMIKDNEDGTYTVTFPGAPDEPITVDAPTDTELAHYGASKEYGTWPQILEKAYGKYCNESFTRRSPMNLGGGDTDHDGADGGSISNDGLRILTGRSVDSETNWATSQDSMHESLTSAFEDGRPVTAYINKENPLADGKTDDLGLPCGHEYAVVGYNPETKEITIRNPWGHGEPMEDGEARDGVDDGTFTLTLDEFNRNFSGLAYAEKE